MEDPTLEQQKCGSCCSRSVDKASLPGPKGLPLLGSILQYKGPRTNLAWAQEYGPIYQVKMGPKQLIYLNTIDLVQKHMEGEKGDLFLDRPPGPAAIAEGLLFGSGAHWETNRWAFMRALHSTTFAEHMENAIRTESTIAIDSLRSHTSKPTRIGDVMIGACANSIVGLLIAGSLPPDSAEREQLMEVARDLESVDLNSILTKVTLRFPRLRGFLNIFLVNEIVDFYGMSSTLQGILRLLVSQSRCAIGSKIEGSPTSTAETEPSSVLMRILEQPEFEDVTEENDSELIQSLMDMFFGGITSSLSSLEYALFYLSKNPDMQSQAQAEVDKCIQDGGEVTWAMREQTPYLRACLVEALRLGAVTPSSLPHVAKADTEIEGFPCARGTLVMASIISLHYNPLEYAQPEEFRPQRHLAEGSLTMPESYKPYGVGARSCVGEKMNEMMMYLFTANILRQFTLKEKVGGSGERHVRIVHRLKEFECVLQTRNVANTGSK